MRRGSSSSTTTTTHTGRGNNAVVVTAETCKAAFLTAVRRFFSLENAALTRRWVAGLAAELERGGGDLEEEIGEEFVALFGTALFSSSPEYLDFRAPLCDFFERAATSPRVRRLLTRDAGRLVLDWSLLVYLFQVIDDSKPSCVDAIVEFLERLPLRGTLDAVINGLFTLPSNTIARLRGHGADDDEEEDDDDDDDTNDDEDFDDSYTSRKKRRKSVAASGRKNRRKNGLPLEHGKEDAVVLGVGEVFMAGSVLSEMQAINVGICVSNRFMVTRNELDLLSWASSAPQSRRRRLLGRGLATPAKRTLAESDENRSEDTEEEDDDDDDEEEDEDEDGHTKLEIWFPLLGAARRFSRKEVLNNNKVRFAIRADQDRALSILVESRYAFLLARAAHECCSKTGGCTRLRLVARLLHDDSPKYPRESTLRGLIKSVTLPRPWTEVIGKLRALGAKRLARDLTNILTPPSSSSSVLTVKQPIALATPEHYESSSSSSSSSSSPNTAREEEAEEEPAPMASTPALIKNVPITLKSKEPSISVTTTVPVIKVKEEPKVPKKDKPMLPVSPPPSMMKKSLVLATPPPSSSSSSTLKPRLAAPFFKKKPSNDVIDLTADEVDDKIEIIDLVDD